MVGGAGFLGSTLCEKLVDRQPGRIVIIDDFSLGRKGNLSKLISREWSEWPRESLCTPAFIHDNITIYRANAARYGVLKKIYEREKIDVTFNLAVISLPVSLITPKKVIDVNLLSVSSLCELLRLGYYSTLIHVSSSEAYGAAIYNSMDERHPTRPITPYAASKLAGDHVVLSYYRTFGVDTAIARPFNCFGPKQNEKRYAAVIPITIERILNGKPPIIYGDGLQTRDFSYSEDIVEGILRVYETPATRGRIVNLATGVEISIQELIGAISDLMGYKGKITYAPPRPGDVRRHRGDVSLARELIGYESKTDYREGLRKTIKWYQKRFLPSEKELKTFNNL